ncbi:uncharacterized protein EV420DRAFT_740920 [Desarmillaria tabescens]|uniref:Uncharacterized protein n=1 Tax=Armillaria tabescens TaxID=1929756 RepID=A0AA39MYI4_ARMTA|nr:uncharacterized protein EV420DRAFT_740920 [Desarmillaria tabescens]KAK0450575.1 hypothetical protein EV420DRAFT_740920 [Desarmillaria tabescens]
MPSSSRSSIPHPRRRPPSPVSMYALPDFGAPKPPKPLVKIEKKAKKSKLSSVLSSSDPSSQTSFPTLSPTSSLGSSLRTTRTSRSSFSLSPLLRRIGIGRKKSVSTVPPPPVPDNVLPVPQHQRREESRPTYTPEGRTKSYGATEISPASSTFPYGATLLHPKTLNPPKTPRRPKTAPSGYVPRNFAPEPWSSQTPPSDKFLHPTRYQMNQSQLSFNDRSIATRSRTSSESSCYSQESALSDRHLRTYNSSILRPDAIQSSSRLHPPSLAPGRLRTLSEISSKTHIPESKPPLMEFSLKSPKSAPIKKQTSLDKINPSQAVTTPPKLKRPRTAPHAFVSRDPALFIAPRPDTPFLHYLEGSRGYVEVSGWRERKQGWSGEWNRDNLQEVIGVLRNLR